MQVSMHPPSFRQDATEGVSMGVESPAPTEVRSEGVMREVATATLSVRTRPPNLSPLAHSISAWAHTVRPQCARTSFALACTHLSRHTPYSHRHALSLLPSARVHPSPQ